MWERAELCEVRLLRIDNDHFDCTVTLRVNQAQDDAIQKYRLARPGPTGNQQMWQPIIPQIEAQSLTGGINAHMQWQFVNVRNRVIEKQGIEDDVLAIWPGQIKIHV